MTSFYTAWAILTRNLDSAYWPLVLWCDMLMKPHALVFLVVHIHTLGMYLRFPHECLRVILNLRPPQECVRVILNMYIKDPFK